MRVRARLNGAGDGAANVRTGESAPPFTVNHETHAMKTRTLALAALAVWGTNAVAADPLQTDPDKYRLLLENDRVRVLEYRDLPGDVTGEHSHPEHVVYALGPAEREQTLPDGETIEMELKTGDVFFVPAQTHIGKNTGEVPSHAILVELKEGAGTPSVPAVEPTAARTAAEK